MLTDAEEGCPGGTNDLAGARQEMRTAVGAWLVASAADDRAALERESDRIELAAGRVAGLLRQLKRASR